MTIWSKKILEPSKMIGSFEGNLQWTNVLFRMSRYVTWFDATSGLKDFMNVTFPLSCLVPSLGVIQSMQQEGVSNGH